MLRLLFILIAALAAALIYVIVDLVRAQRKIAALEGKGSATPANGEQHNSVIRHDLKGILNRVFALARLIPMSGPVNEAQQEYLRKIEEQCSEGKAAINQMFPKKNQG